MPQQRVVLQDKNMERAINAMFKELYDKANTPVPTTEGQGGLGTPNPLSTDNPTWWVDTTGGEWVKLDISSVVPKTAKWVWGTLILKPGRLSISVAPSGDGNGAVTLTAPTTLTADMTIPFMLPLTTPSTLWYKSA